MIAPPTPKHARRRSAAEVIGERESRAITARLGSELLSARRSLQLTQAEMAARVGLSASRYADLEHGKGGTAPLETWVALGFAISRPLGVAFSRSLVPEPRDAGDLNAQEYIIGLARAAGLHHSFEFLSGREDRNRFADVAIRDEARRTFVLVEVGNRVDDFGQGVRDFQRKLVEAIDSIGAVDVDEGPFRIAACWVLRASASNQALVRRYPGIIEAAFPGSSRGWVKALTQGGPWPERPGVVWIDLAGTRLYDVRLRSS